MNAGRDDPLVDDSQFAEIFAACLEVRERGETIDADQLRKEYPDHADAVLSFFSDRSQLDQWRDGCRLDGLPTDDADECDRLSDVMARETFLASRPRQLGDFRILREVGRGGMGVVLRGGAGVAGSARRDQGTAASPARRRSATPAV